MSRPLAYSSTTECSVKLPGRCPRSIRLRRRSPSTASSICTGDLGVPSTASSCSRRTGSRRIANHSSTLCSRAERRSNCSSSSWRTPPKTTSPCSRTDSYPHFTNGDEKQSERLQETFAKRASLSRSSAIQEDHHGNEPDSHPGVLPPSRRSRWSSWQASVQSAGPPPPASAAQLSREPGALAPNARTPGSATSAPPEGTTVPTNGSDHQRFAIAVAQYDSHF